MTDRPIIFSAPMVRAMLDGRKTMTRRLIQHPGPGWVLDPMRDAAAREGYFWFTDDPDERPGYYLVTSKWRPGDRLWVRESWKPHSTFDDLAPRDLPKTRIFYLADYAYSPSGSRGRASIHMPRWASRLTLIVTSVKIERLQDISEADALAEGIERLTFPDRGDWGWPQAKFRELWNSINGPGAWDANPWVAAISFDVRKGNIDEVSA